jgi:transposase
MKWIHGKAREQAVLFPTSLDEIIAEDNEVRLIDLFVESLSLESYNFDVSAVEDGRPKYHPKVLLKLFIYGYMNRIRSSRLLERACKINVEVMWLVQQLSPDHNTINNFRKTNEKGIRNVFQQTVNIAKDFELIGGKLLAGDSTKFRAQNSKKNNYNIKKVKRHIEYIETKLAEYQALLDECEGGQKKDDLVQEIEKQKARKAKYQELEEELSDIRIKQISTSDPDSRQMIIRNNITEVAYNVQTTVDSTNNLLIDYVVTNTNDKKAMGTMIERAVEIIGHTEMTILYNKGYHTGSEFSKAEAAGVDVLVAKPGVPSASQAPDPKYNRSEFKYNEEQDSYTCPEGQILTPAPSTYTHRNSNKPDYTYTFKKYRTTACRQCPAKERCTRNKTNVRHIDRTEHTGAIDRNKERIENSENYYKRRQAIVEHPYGTIKRQWGFDHIMTKRKIECASSDIGLMMSAYNLRRLFNLLEFRDLANYLNEILKNLIKNSFFIVQQIFKHQGIKLYFRNLIINGKITRGNKHILGVSF